MSESPQNGKFVLKAPYAPRGDQPQAIDALAKGVLSGLPCQPRPGWIF